MQLTQGFMPCVVSASQISWLVQSLSLRPNVTKLISLEREPGCLNCLHGIRVVSLFMILMAHRYYAETIGAVSNFVDVLKFFEPVYNQIVANTILNVDTFFFLSGFLLCYIFLKELERNGKFRPIQYYIYRYIRLTVPLAVVLAYYIVVFPYMGRGPLWSQVLAMTYSCKTSWWQVLLYIQNYFIPNPIMCITQSWYLAVDMQLSWFAPLFMIPLYKWPKQTLYFALILLAASCFAPFAVTYVNSLPWSQTWDTIYNPELALEFSTKIYWPTYMRVTPYLAGVLLAYFMYQTKNRKVKLPLVVVIAGWISSVAVGLTVIFTLSIPNQPEYEYNRIGAAFYAGFHKLGWSYFIAWIIFACVNGFGGIVDRFFSWKYFLPLSRLSYSAYLVQFLVIMYDSGIGRTAHSFGHYAALHKFIGDQPMIFGIAMLLYLLVELPVLNILRHFYRSKGALNQKLVNFQEQSALPTDLEVSKTDEHKTKSEDE